MKNSKSESYAAAGVDITAGYRAVELMKAHIARTMTAGVCSDVGSFGGLFELDVTGMTRPVLVSGTDGVGTKLKMAFLLDKHDTVGIDCVAMCVNDIICAGAKPLFFLDYIACGKNIPERIESIVKGVCEGCVQSGAALIGGETAEMPGFYPVDEYDLAGFAVGVVDKTKVLDKNTMREGDVVIIDSPHQIPPFTALTNTPEDKRLLVNGETAQWFLEHKVKCVGFGDGVSIENRNEDVCPFHDILLAENILFIEVMKNLDKLSKDVFFISYAPMNVVGLDSCSVRAYAIEGLAEFS
jgi:hypothetical protein